MKLHVRSFALGALIVGLAAAGVALLRGARESGVASPAPSGREAAPPRATNAPADAPDASAPRGRADAGAARRTPRELGLALLAAKSRLEQVQAIAALTDDGTPEAMQILLDAFVSTDDGVLLALLEEALLKSPSDMSPSFMAAFQGSSDPKKLERLANLLRHAVANRPELSDLVVAFLIRALDDADAARNGAAAAALQLLGRGAVDQLAARLRDARCSPETAGALAEILSKLPEQYEGVVRDKVTEGFESTRDVLRDPNASDADKDAARKKTGSIAWIASSRSPGEHDALAPILADQLGRTTDPGQAGTLAWGLGELRGLSDTGRTQTASVLLDALSRQNDGDVRLIMSRSLVQLAQSGVAASNEALRNKLSSAEAAETDPKVKAQLQAMLAKLDAAGGKGK